MTNNSVKAFKFGCKTFLGWIHAFRVTGFEWKRNQHISGCMFTFRSFHLSGKRTIDLSAQMDSSTGN